MRNSTFVLLIVWTAATLLSGSANAGQVDTPPSGLVVDQLRTGLASKEPLKRLEAISAAVADPLDQQQRDAVIPALLDALDDEVPDVRAHAAKAIGTFGSQAEYAIPKLISKLSDDGITLELKGVWAACSLALGQIGPAAIEPMTAALKESDAQTYRGIMGALAEMKDAAKETVPTLIMLLRHGPEDRSWPTMFALCGIGKAASPAIPDLMKRLDHEDFNIQCIACRALAAIGPEARVAAPKLVHLIENGNPSARGQAATALGAIGPVPDVDSVEILVGMLNDGNQIIRERAMAGIGYLGPAASEATPVVKSALNDPDFWPKPEAAKTLWRISGDSTEAVSKLIELMGSLSHDVRAMEVLAEMGPDAQAASESLAEKLKSDDQGVRLLAARAFSNMGPAASAYREALEARLEDSDPDVAEVLEEAIERME